MVKLVIPVLFLVVACSGSTPFCDCIQKGEELNQLTERTLSEGVISAEEANQIKQLKSEKDNLCKEYQTMSGQEMLKLKQACEHQ